MRRRRSRAADHLRSPDAFTCGHIIGKLKNSAFSAYFQIGSSKLPKMLASPSPMIHDDPDPHHSNTMRKLEAQIRSLANELLSTSDYPESVQIATDLIAVIHTLLEVRSQTN